MKKDITNNIVYQNFYKEHAVFKIRLYNAPI